MEMTKVFLVDSLNITGFEVRPVKKEDDHNVTSHIPESEAEFWGVYANLEDGTQKWLADLETKELAVQFSQLLQDVITAYNNPILKAALEILQQCQFYVNEGDELWDTITEFLEQTWHRLNDTHTCGYCMNGAVPNKGGKCNNPKCGKETPAG